MYQFFCHDSAVNRVNLVIPSASFVAAGLQRENKKIINYVRQNPTRVKSDHVISRLIGSVNIDFNISPKRQAELVGVISQNLARTLHFVIEGDKGKIQPKSCFYGKSVKEVIVSIDEPFDMDTENWQDLRPLNVLYHGMMQLTPPILDGSREYQAGGFAIIKINIPMLIFQYQSWRRAVNQKLVIPLSEEHFIRTYPIANMIYSHQDFAIFNMTSSLSMEFNITPYKNYYPFPYLDYTQKMKAVLELALEAVGRRSLPFEGLLEALPSVNSLDMWHSLLLPAVSDTRQIKWALTIARLPVINFLLRYDSSNPNSVNNNVKNKWRQDVLEWFSDKPARDAVGYVENEKLDRYIKENVKSFF